MNAIQGAADDLRNRRPIWQALSELFLDSDTSCDHNVRVHVLASSPYSIEQLEQILIEEVYPVCRSNLLSPAGVWSGFDGDWLERNVLAGERSMLLRLQVPLTSCRFSVARALIPRWSEWKRLKAEIVEVRKSAGSP